MKKILLIDDSRALRTLVVRHLKEKGWLTFEADDGQAGVLLALQHRPDLILLDVAMPYMDGPAALLKIRTKESIRNTPVIMMTAASDRETVVKLARLGIQDYIVKPFTLDLLIDKIEKVLSAQKPVEEPPAPPPAPSPADAEPINSPERPNLLLVCMSMRNSTLLRNTLSAAYDLFLAPDGEQAIQLSMTYPPHAVIVDLNHTQEDPVEIYKRLRYLPHLLRTPFIAVRRPDPEMQERAERAGIIHFLNDPIDPIALNRLFIALDNERQAGVYGASYLHLQQGVPTLRWPEALRAERLKETTYDIEDNLVKLHQQGQRRLVVQIGALRTFHDAHLLLMLAVLKKAKALGLELAFVTQNQNAVSFFRQYEDTRELTFYASVGDVWQALIAASLE
jgi:two-component system cell cycle response regulator